MRISSKTRLDDLLEAHPFLKERLPEINNAFSMLPCLAGFLSVWQSVDFVNALSAQHMLRALCFAVISCCLKQVG